MRLKYRYRAAIFIGILFLLVLGRSLPTISTWMTAVSPFAGISAVGGKFHQQGGFSSIEISACIVITLFSVFFCLLRHRFLCHMVCPLGFCFDLIDRIRKKTTGEKRPAPFLRFVPKLGVFLASFTWIGCFCGIVGFLWLDPFVLFGTLFRGTTPLVFVLVFLFGFAWFAPAVWCRCFCPLGGTQDILSFPRNAPRYFVRKGKTGISATVSNPRQRRLLLHSLLLIGCSGLGFIFLRRSNRQNVLRPPGAVCEPYFSALCSRCGACVSACPENLLKGSLNVDDVLACGTPQIEFVSAWCRDDCIACTRVCPTGALTPLSLGTKNNHKIGIAVIQFEWCRLYDDVECTICGRECPYDAIRFQWSEEEYRRIPVIDSIKCTGCGRCIVTCPVKSDPPLTVKTIM